MRSDLSGTNRPLQKRQLLLWFAGVAGLAVIALSMTYLLGQRAPDPLVLPNAALEGVGAHLTRVTITAWEPLSPGQDAAAAAARLAAALTAAPASGDERAVAPGPGNERLTYTLSGEPGGALTITLHPAAPATLAAIMELPAAAPWWTWRDRMVTALADAEQTGGVTARGGGTARTYTVLEYDAAGRRLWRDRDRIARGVLRRLGARTVEGVNDGQLYSLTAYSPRLRARLNVAGHPVNTAVALHWDEVSGQTKLWLGSPVINIEY